MGGNLQRTICSRAVVEQTQEEFGLSVSLVWSETGYRFSCPWEELNGQPLPRGLLSIDRSKHTAKFTTPELVGPSVGACYN